MKIKASILLTLACCGSAWGQGASPYTNFIRQVQLPTGVQWDAAVAASGERSSSLPVDVGGARFELWTVKSSPLTSYLLDTRFVNAYIPSATVSIRSEDPYTLIPRTRADRPFFVDITVSGLLSGGGDPAASKSVKLLRHVQSYGVGGVGENLDRSQATLLSQSFLTENLKEKTLSYEINSVPSADRTKACGEERFSIYSLGDANFPESQITSRYIQIWPVADGSIAGISNDEKIRFKMPKLTFNLNDLYPESTTYAQVYPGEQKLGTQGVTLKGSSLILSESVATSRVLVLDNYDSVFTGDGRWTMELLTVTPFGVDRLAWVTFEIDRTIELNGTFTTME
jgi:hypothetical protein